MKELLRESTVPSIREIDLTQDAVDKYAPSCYNLRHARIDKVYKGKILLDGNEVVGFVNVNKLSDEIQAVWVNEKYRRSGYATKLLSIARGIGANRLWVFDNNINAQKLYDKTGWKRTGKVNGRMIEMVKESTVMESKLTYKRGTLMPFEGDIDSKHIVKTTFEDSGKDVCWYFYKGKKLRMRAEVLLVDDEGKMYAHIKEKAWNAHACGYALPGGGLEHDDKDYAKCAAREAQEEARITPSPCRDTGIRYWVQYSNPENADNSPGALTILCIGKAGRRYTGYIAPEDRDSMLKGGDWYYPKDLPGFHKYHREAYNKALKEFGINAPVQEGLFDAFKTKHSDSDLLKANMDYIGMVKKDGQAYWKTHGLKISDNLYNMSPEETTSEMRRKMIGVAGSVFKQCLSKVPDKTFQKAVKLRGPGRDEIDDFISNGQPLWIGTWNLWNFTSKARTDEQADLYFWSLMQYFLNECNIRLGNRSFKLEQEGDWDDGVINLTDRNVKVQESIIPEDDGVEVLYESPIPSDKHAVFIIFKRDRKSLLNNLISRFTKSFWSHVAISFDIKLIEMYSFLISTDGFGVENLKNYSPDTDIKVMCGFVDNSQYKRMKSVIADYHDKREETGYQYKNFIACLTRKTLDKIEDPMHMVCSNFVDFILRAGDLSPVKLDWSTTHPGRLHRALASSKRKFITVFKGPVKKYNPNEIKMKVDELKITTEAYLPEV